MSAADWIFRLKSSEYYRILMHADWKELRDFLDESMPSADPALKIELSFVVRHMRNLLQWYANCAEEIVRETADPEARLTALAALALDDVRPAGLSDRIEKGLQETRKSLWEDAIAPLRAPGGRDARN
ncbi:MAG: hypothetical protein ABSG38_16060 [Spirochaetia bacterium]|jgi:hypothetical protein